MKIKATILALVALNAFAGEADFNEKLRETDEKIALLKAQVNRERVKSEGLIDQALKSSDRIDSVQSNVEKRLESNTQAFFEGMKEIKRRRECCGLRGVFEKIFPCLRPEKD